MEFQGIQLRSHNYPLCCREHCRWHEWWALRLLYRVKSCNRPSTRRMLSSMLLLSAARVLYTPRSGPALAPVAGRLVEWKPLFRSTESRIGICIRPASISSVQSGSNFQFRTRHLYIQLSEICTVYQNIDRQTARYLQVSCMMRIYSMSRQSSDFVRTFLDGTKQN